MPDLYRLPQRNTDLSGIVWIAFGVSLMGALLTLWIATEYVAWALGWAPALGQPLIGRLYNPLDGLKWSFRYYNPAYGPDLMAVFSHEHAIITVGACLTLISGGALTYRRRRLRHVTVDLHGSAHWASREEIYATGLLGAPAKQAQGVYVGAWLDPKDGRTRYLTHAGPEHVLAFAPTRSGKGVGLVIPTLLTWPHSVLVHDLKGENWAVTAGARQHVLHTCCLKFDPTCTDGTAAHFNPLAEVRIGTPHEVMDVQNITTMIVDPEGRGLLDHWAKTGHALLVGTILHVLYAEREKTLRGVASFLSDPGRSGEQTLYLMKETPHRSLSRHWPYGEGSVHPVIAEAAQEVLNKTPNERSGVLSTAMSFLSLYRDPIVAENTRTSDFSIRDLMHADQPVSLYLVVPASDKDRLKPLLRLLLNQVLRTLTEHLAFEDGQPIAHYRHPLLLLIDEFPALGKLDVFAESLGFFAAYGLKAYLLVQDLSQLYAAYGRDESILSNCHIRIAHAPNKVETAELLSKMAGHATVRYPSRTYTGNRLNPILMHVMASEQDTERRLLTPDEAMRLPEEDMLIFCAGHAPIYGRKIRYYRDRQFVGLARSTKPPDLSGRLAPPASLPGEASPKPAGDPSVPISLDGEGGRRLELELPHEAPQIHRSVVVPEGDERKVPEPSTERTDACAQAQALRLVRLGDEEARAARHRVAERHREAEPGKAHDRGML